MKNNKNTVKLGVPGALGFGTAAVLILLVGLNPWISMAVGITVAVVAGILLSKK